MASSSFRDSMNSLGWSRREQTANTNPQNPLLGTLSKLNPFSGEGYVRLPTTEGEGPGAPLPARTRREEEEGWFALSRWDRLLLFGGLNLAAIALFVVCFTLLPILSLRPRKFAILYVSLPVLSRQFQICTLVQPLSSTIPCLLNSRGCHALSSSTFTSDLFHHHYHPLARRINTCYRRHAQPIQYVRPRALMQWELPPDHKVVGRIRPLLRCKELVSISCTSTL
ncbi:hypothetical protein AC578_8785 [Pseudocercospora eumusae]|uniref:Protein transport protein SFT2 n=1 Tax=Pseudocercospora eumusae TaxID=321146 RepID=A0A139H6G9_9PEZI|nr:hypothetical protein AC578_8785 [Pseudocercospora eumusae]KXS98047.1 hypothetical protein AC578_8785 [Pseudocercospora eumusae]